MDNKDFFLQAETEFNSSKRDEALWIKSLTLKQGDEEKAKHTYITLRVEELTISSKETIKKNYKKNYLIMDKKIKSGIKNRDIVDNDSKFIFAIIGIFIIFTFLVFSLEDTNFSDNNFSDNNTSNPNEKIYSSVEKKEECQKTIDNGWIISTPEGDFSYLPYADWYLPINGSIYRIYLDGVCKKIKRADNIQGSPIKEEEYISMSREEKDKIWE